MNYNIFDLGREDPTIFWPEYQEQTSEMPARCQEGHYSLGPDYLIGEHSRQLTPNKLRIKELDDRISEIMETLRCLEKEFFTSNNGQLAKIYLFDMYQQSDNSYYMKELDAEINEQENIINLIDNNIIPQEEIDKRLQQIEFCRKKTHYIWDTVVKFYNLRKLEAEDALREQRRMLQEQNQRAIEADTATQLRRTNLPVGYFAHNNTLKRSR